MSVASTWNGGHSLRTGCGLAQCSHVECAVLMRGSLAVNLVSFVTGRAQRMHTGMERCGNERSIHLERWSLAAHGLWVGTVLACRMCSADEGEFGSESGFNCHRSCAAHAHRYGKVWQ